MTSSYDPMLRPAVDKSGPKHHLAFTVGGRAISFDLNHHESWEGRLLYEPEVMDAMSRFVQPGDCVIDAGANLGFFSLFLSRLVGADGCVMAFEPDPDVLQQLRANIAINDIENVYSVYQALWSHDCEMDFHPSPDHLCGYSSFVQFEESKPKLRQQVRSLDSLLTSERFNRPRLIKIDCEGAECAILFGAQSMLERKIDCVIAEFNFHLMGLIGTSDRQIRDYMFGLGYEMFLLQNGYRPMHVPNSTTIQIEQGGVANMMFADKAQVDELWSKPVAISI